MSAHFSSVMPDGEFRCPCGFSAPAHLLGPGEAVRLGFLHVGAPQRTLAELMEFGLGRTLADV